MCSRIFDLMVVKNTVETYHAVLPNSSVTHTLKTSQICFMIVQKLRTEKEQLVNIDKLYQLEHLCCIMFSLPE